MTRVVCYTRVSTDQQERDGASLDQQESACRAHAVQQGLEIVDVVRDVVSGRSESTDRPKLQAALGRLGQDAEGILVWNLDRFSRNLVDALKLARDHFGESKPYKLFSATEDVNYHTPEGRLMLHMKLSVAEYEADKIRQRIRASKTFLAQQGYFQGGPSAPYGYSVGPREKHAGKRRRKLVPDRSEQKVVRHMVKLSRRGLSLRAIAADLEERGVVNRTGQPFHPMQVARVLRHAEQKRAS